MHQIRHWLYVGSFAETHDRDTLDTHGIGAMLQLAAPADQPGIETKFMRVDDASLLPENAIREGVAFIRSQKAAGQDVLIACRQGISRSTTFAIAALAEEENLPLMQAYEQVTAAHPDARPHPALLLSLMHYYNDHSMLSTRGLAS